MNVNIAIILKDVSRDNALIIRNMIAEFSGLKPEDFPMYSCFIPTENKEPVGAENE